ncbi:hypothetical protein GEMRC1_008652 [Eukaryota sp. GEM-RC1]
MFNKVLALLRSSDESDSVVRNPESIEQPIHGDPIHLPQSQISLIVYHSLLGSTNSNSYFSTVLSLHNVLLNFGFVSGRFLEATTVAIKSHLFSLPFTIDSTYSFEWINLFTFFNSSPHQIHLENLSSGTLHFNPIYVLSIAVSASEPFLIISNQIL